MRRGRHARALDEEFAFLDHCPAHVREAIITLPGDDARAYVAGIQRWKDALLLGQVPAASHAIGLIDAPVRAAIEQLGIARFCRGAPDLVDALLEDIVRAWRRGQTAIAAETSKRLRELEALERQRRDAEAKAKAELSKPPVVPQPLTPEDIEALRARALQEATDRERGPDGDVMEAWAGLVRSWTQVSDVFGDLGNLLGRGWDLSQGILRHTGWRDIEALRQLVERLPELREIVEALGRLQDATDGTAVAEQVLRAVRRVDEELREVRAPEIAIDVVGVERSGEITRMLPSEAVLLGHPRLRMLWHARRAERALLTYSAEGTRTERVVLETESQESIDEERPRPVRGPVVAVIDTSGSMQGLPERVAKALVLETLRVAHSESRRCYLYAFSGPSELAEHELELTEDGIGRLLEFLGSSFGGGTDPATAVEAVARRLEQPDWTRADVLLVSDGEFGVQRSVKTIVDRARKAGTRFHGVLVGRRGWSGLEELCEPLHVFGDWLSAGNQR